MRIAGHRILSRLLDMLFPPKCLACGAFIDWRSTRCDTIQLPADRLHTIACAACRQQVQHVQSPLCTVCGQTFSSRQGTDHLCGACLAEPHQYDQARAALIFDGPVVELIHQYKYRAKLRLARPFGMLLRKSFECFWPAGGADLAIPVPLHSRRRRQRGFNQAYVMLLRAIDAGLAVNVNADALHRVRHTPTQTGLDRQARKENMRKAFVVGNPKAIAGRHVLLVDDVMTTGATIDACALALKAAGASRVDALTLARVL